MTKLDALRRRIDELDEQLVTLLSERAACALDIGHEKKLAGLEIYQPAREAEVLAHVQRVNPGPLDNGAMRRLFERIIDEGRRLERIADESASGDPGTGPSGDLRSSDHPVTRSPEAGKDPLT